MTIKTNAKGLIDFLNYTKNETNNFVQVAHQVAKKYPEDSSNVYNKQYYMYKDTVKYCDSQIKCITKKYKPNDIIEIEIFIDIDN